MKTASHTNQTESPIASVGRKNELFFKSVKSDCQPFFVPATVQAKLEIGRPNDQYEKQADRVADKVIQMPDTSNSVHRKGMEEEEELQMKQEPILQRKCKECEQEDQLQSKQKIQAKSADVSSSMNTNTLFKTSGVNSNNKPFEPAPMASIREVAGEPMVMGDWKAWIGNGEVINNSSRAVTVWSSDNGTYTIPAHSRSESWGEDVDHVRDVHGQWWKIGWNTAVVDSNGEVSGAKCPSPGRGQDCGQLGDYPALGTENTVHAKLKLNQPADRFEQEADAIADKVVNSEASIQRKCAECEKEENLQMKENGSSEMGVTIGDRLSSNLQSSRGSGSRLPEGIQAEMSQKIGADFNGVNIHTNTDASEMSRTLGARAFTHGNDIYFNSGEYNPSTRDGKHLLAHELTHVAQQGKATDNRIQREALSDEQRDNYVTNIIAEMGTTHTDYNDGAQDADQAISAAAQANADLAKALFSISMAIIVPGFGGVISSFATRIGITLTTSVADRIGGVIGEAAKIAGENEINEAFQSTEQNKLFIAIANGLEESARIKRQHLLQVKYDNAALPDTDLVQLHDYWLALGRLDRDDWNQWFQEKYSEYQQQVQPIGEQTDQRYGTNKLRWIEGTSWRGLALTGEGRYFMATGRPTFMSWISPFYRDPAVRKHEQALGSSNISAVHYTNLETGGGTTRSDFENILDRPYMGYDNIVREQAQGNVQQGSGSTCPTCHGQGGGIGPEFNQEPIFDFNQFERNQPADDVDTDALRRWIEALESE